MGKTTNKAHTICNDAELKALNDLLACCALKATEATLLGVKSQTDLLTFTGDDLNVNASVSIPAGLATEVTLEAIRVLTDSLNNKDFATELTLEAIRVLVASLDSKDFATEATLNAIKTQTDKLTFTADKLKTTGEDAGGVGGGSISEKLLQVDSVGTTTYLGYADAGTLTSASLWAVKKIVETAGDVSITWADGNTGFDNVWNDRLILTYA